MRGRGRERDYYRLYLGDQGHGTTPMNGWSRWVLGAGCWVVWIVGGEVERVDVSVNERTFIR